MSAAGKMTDQLLVRPRTSKLLVDDVTSAS